MRFPQHLLDQASCLANLEKRRPRQASLRRAVSTAYYALFHLLTSAAVANWKKPRQRHALARVFEHANMHEACKKTNDKAFPNPNHPNVRHLKRIANTFMQLQQHRHTADYDNSKCWTRTEVLTHIELARDAFETWEIISKDPFAEDFLLLLLVNRRGRN
jgi:uncharacterized protein (UPF0332 family)